MRTFDNGAGFTVSYSEADADEFADIWPGSTVSGAGSFGFANNGDLIDWTGSAHEYDGPDWLAFSQDCHNYGAARIEALRRRHERAQTRKGEQCTPNAPRSAK